MKARPIFDENNGCLSVVYFGAVFGFHKSSSMYNMYSNTIMLDFFLRVEKWKDVNRMT